MGQAPTAEQLLADASWLRRLAERLAGASDADDLVQETWIAAWQRAPDPSRPLRPWLAKVLRDTVRMRRRADRRRHQRETALDEPVPARSPAELLEQARLHERLVELVLAMDEPFRTTLLMRFLDGRSAADIARASGLPEGTVRWRIHEALARLRADLDARERTRRAWAPAAFALAEKGFAVAKTTKSLIVVLALLALLLGGAAVRSLALDGTDEPSTPQGAVRAPLGPAGWQVETHAQLVADDRPPGWFAQEGVAPRRIAGRVLVDGAPASGASVRLEDEASRAGLVATRERRTSADGRFDFGIQPATHYELGAHLPGRVATVERVDLRDPRVRADDLVVALEPCVSGIYGHVVDASGGPIAHAHLLARGVIGTHADEQGAFDLCLTALGVTPEERRLVVRAAGYGTVELTASLPGRVRRDFMLSPEATLSGRVTTEAGRPVPMANVRVHWDEAAPHPGTERPAVGHAVSDADGRFELAGLAAGRLRIDATARGAASTPLTVEVAAGGTQDVALTLRERGVLRGRVLSNGRPLAGVSVFDRAQLPTYQARGQVTFAIDEAVSQADGTFVLDGLPVGTRTLGTSPHRFRSPATVDIVAGEQAAELELEVEPLGALAGTVRRNGQPVPHTLVRVVGRTWTHTRSTKTDDAGRYAIEGLDADAYRLWAYSPVAGAFAEVDPPIAIEPPARVERDVELRHGGRVSGRVVDANGAAVRGAFVKLQHTATDDLGLCTTDAAGHFSCAGMTGGGEYRITVASTEASPAPYAFIGAPPAPILVHDGDAHVREVRLVVEVRSLAIRGVVVDRAGAPVSDARVIANAGAHPTPSAPTSVTNMHGHFELAELAPGSYDVHVLGIDGSKAQLERVAAGATNVRVVLAPPSCDDTIDRALGRVQREVPHAIAHRPATRVVWDDRIELLGWSMPPQIRAGTDFEIELIYQVLQPIERSWKIFIHLDGPKRRINADHDPLGGRCPMSTWKPGDVIITRTTVRLDPAHGAYESGSYDVWIGFFSGWNPSWRNLELTAAPEPRDAFHRLKLTSVALQQ